MRVADGQVYRVVTLPHAKKREIVKRLKQKFHGTVPSKMSRDRLISYIYSVARDLNVNWEPLFESHAASIGVGGSASAGDGNENAAKEKRAVGRRRPELLRHTLLL